MSSLQRLVLASGSPRRLALLQQAGVEPDRLMPADIDETPQKSEHPRSLAKRLSKGKAEVAARRLHDLDYGPATILAADTVVSVGRQIMPKAELAEDALANLRTLSGRTHRVYTGVCVIGPNGALRQRLIETRVRFKRLSRQDIQSYVASDEWRGKAGGYAIQGLAGSFVVRLVGSYTNVVGLPLAETLALLAGEGYDIHARWRAPQMDVPPEDEDPDEDFEDDRRAGGANDERQGGFRPVAAPPPRALPPAQATPREDVADDALEDVVLAERGKDGEGQADGPTVAVDGPFGDDKAASTSDASGEPAGPRADDEGRRTEPSADKRP